MLSSKMQVHQNLLLVPIHSHLAFDATPNVLLPHGGDAHFTLTQPTVIERIITPFHPVEDHGLGHLLGNLFLVISSIAVQLGHKLCGFIHAHEFTQHGLVIGDAVSRTTRQVRGLDLFFQVFQDLLWHRHVQHHATAHHHLT